MFRHDRNRGKGFTLLEVLIAVAILGIVVTTTYTVFISTSRNAIKQKKEVLGRQHIQNSLELMSGEIAFIGYHRNKDDILTATADAVTFYADIDNDGQISFDRDGSNDIPDTERISIYYSSQHEALFRTEEEGDPMTLLEDVTSFAFSYYDDTGNLLDDDPDTAGQQITTQATRDDIRRVRVVLETTPTGYNGSIAASKDIYLPNMEVEDLEECGNIAMSAANTLKACEPPGDRGQVVITSYDMNGDPTNVNDITLSTTPGSVFYTTSDGETEVSTLAGGNRSASSTVWLGSGITEAGQNLILTARWTPEEPGCFERITNAKVNIIPGDPCQILFVNPPDEIPVCSGDPYAENNFFTVIAVDNCSNPVPNRLITLSIVDNETHDKGTLNGSYLSSNVLTDITGKATFSYAPPDDNVPDTATFRATLTETGDLECTPNTAQHTVALIPASFSEVTALSPSYAIGGCMNSHEFISVRAVDNCDNIIQGLTGLTATIASPVGGENVSDMDGSNPNSATAVETNPSGVSTPGTYWIRYNTRTDQIDTVPRTATVTFSHADLAENQLLEFQIDACTCDLSVLEYGESFCRASVPYQGGPVTKLRSHVNLTTSRGRFTVPYGNGTLYTDAEATQQYTPGTLLPEDGQEYKYIYLLNDGTELNSEIGIQFEEVTVTTEGELQVIVPICQSSIEVPVDCSEASIHFSDVNGGQVEAYDPTDDESNDIYISLTDKNISSSMVTVIVVSEKGDSELVTLTNGHMGMPTYFFKNASPITLDMDASPSHNNGVLAVNFVDEAWVSYQDSTTGCTCSESASDSVEVSGCQDLRLFDDMEDGAEGWSHQARNAWELDYTYDDWQLGDPSSFGSGTTPDSCASGTNCWATDLDGDYGAYNRKEYEAWLFSPTFSLSGMEDARLFFNHWVDIEAGNRYRNSGAWVEISTNGGDSWSHLFFPTYNATLDSESSRNYYSCWAEAYTSGAWLQEELDLSGYTGHSSVKLKFAIFTDNSDWASREGWLIDDVMICGASGD